MIPTHSRITSYATPDMERSMRLCCESARTYGVQEAWPWFHAVTKTLEFYRENQALLDNPKGAGLWAWKPFLIAHHLQQMHDDSILIYADAGIEFIDNVNHIIDRMDQNIFLFGNQWEHAHWCKRDVIDAIIPTATCKCSGPYGTQQFGWCDECHMDRAIPTPWERFGKQAQASVIFFRVNDTTRAFVKEWLDWCLFEGGRLIDDSPSRTPNHPEFRENRHDQAILTTMAYRDGIKLHWWPAMYNDGAFIYERGAYPDEGYPVLFHHHRKRNHEWEQVA